MDGFEFVKLIEAELKARNIKKEVFYKESGISSATMSQWRKRIYSPSPENIKRIENYLGITFSIVQKEKTPAPKGAEVNLGYLELNAENRAFIDYMIEKLIKSQSEN